MPWWFWILLWTVLLLGTALFLVLCGIRLFRGFVRLADDFGAAAEALALPPAAAARTGGGPPRPAAGLDAVFRDPGDAREEFTTGRSVRREARRLRRVERKRLRGQPQRLGDLHLR